MRAFSKLVVFGLLFILPACTQTLDFDKQADQLVGYTEDEILACAGLPDGSLNLDKGRSALLYSQRRLSVSPSPFGRWGSWGACPWGSLSQWCDSPFLRDDINVEEETCRLALWTEAGKIIGVTGEYSPMGLQLCRKIIAPCLAAKSQVSPAEASKAEPQI